jgi:hypothetical protein
VKQKLHLLCATNRVPLSYDELTSANVADVLLVGELLSETGLEGGGIARRLFGDLWPTAEGHSERN